MHQSRKSRFDRDAVADLDLPSHGWFTIDLDHVLLRTEAGEREIVLSQVRSRGSTKLFRLRGEGGGASNDRSVRLAMARPSPSGGRRVPDGDIVAVGRQAVRLSESRVPRPERDPRKAPRRPWVLAALLGLGLIGLTVQHWPQRPPIVVPVSLQQGVMVT